MLCGPQQLPRGAHDRRRLQQGLCDKDLQEQRGLCCVTLGELDNPSELLL